MIRKAVNNDLCEIFRIWNDAHHSNYGWPKVEEIPRDLLEVVQTKRTYVRLTNGEITGWIAWEPDGQNCVLNAIYVDPAFQRRGVGSELLEFMKSQIATTPALSISAAVLKKGASAMKFYKNRGFHICDVGDVDLNQCNLDLLRYLERRKDGDHAYVAIKKLRAT